MTETPIHEVARLTGTTTRTLRHYGDIGLLRPSRVADSGYRYYDSHALARLQRILLLRRLGLSLPAIGEVLAGERDPTVALAAHLAGLRAERDRVDRQARSLERTIEALREGKDIMAHEMLDGFDHTAHREEVVERWGAKAYEDSDRWFRSLGAEGRADWQERHRALAADWIAAAERGIPADGDEAQALAERHVQWLSAIPGTPGHSEGRPQAAYLTGLGEMYVADPRFAANYGGDLGARFVRDALASYVARQ